MMKVLKNQQINEWNDISNDEDNDQPISSQNKMKTPIKGMQLAVSKEYSILRTFVFWK
jgi:hypothetical protein